MHISFMSTLYISLCLLPFLTRADTYWIDGSCAEYENKQPGKSFRASVREAIDFARIANDRLGDNRDTDTKRLFAKMFQTDTGNPDAGNVGKVGLYNSSS